MSPTPTADHEEPHEAQVTALRGHIAYLEQALAAISSGGVDAVVLGLAGEERVYTLSSADRSYRAIVESMGEGALTVSNSGVVLYANARVATFLGVERDAMIGSDIATFVDPTQRDVIRALLQEPEPAGETRRAELELARPGGPRIPFLVSVTGIDIDEVRVQCLVLTDMSLQRELEQQRTRQAAEDERQAVVREVNDTIVQGLVTAEMAYDLGQHDYARDVIASTSERARQWIGELAEGRRLMPGMAVRRTAAPPGAPEVP